MKLRPFPQGLCLGARVPSWPRFWSSGATCHSPVLAICRGAALTTVAPVSAEQPQQRSRGAGPYPPRLAPQVALWRKPSAWWRLCACGAATASRGLARALPVRAPPQG